MNAKDSAIQYAQTVASAGLEIAQNPKVAHGSAIATFFTGLGTALEKIDLNIGVVASSFGVLLTITLIVINIRKDRRDTEKHNLEKQRLLQIIEKEGRDK